MSTFKLPAVTTGYQIQSQQHAGSLHEAANLSVNTVHPEHSRFIADLADRFVVTGLAAGTILTQAMSVYYASLSMNFVTRRSQRQLLVGRGYTQDDCRRAAEDYFIPRGFTAVSDSEGSVTFMCFDDPSIKVPTVVADVITKDYDNFSPVVYFHGLKEYIEPHYEEFLKLPELKHSLYVATIQGDGIGSRAATISDRKLGRTEFYPWLKTAKKRGTPWDLNEYIDAYIRSDRSILYNYCDGGTGKSTFIRTLIQRSKLKSLWAFREEIVSNPKIFDFVDSEDFQLLALEDADRIVEANGNLANSSVMASLLNETDGVGDDSNKKLIISVNLSSMNKVHKPLTRDARCYDIIHFNPYTYEEAKVVAESLGLKIPLDPKRTYNLGQITGALDDERVGALGETLVGNAQRQGFGFTG